MGEKNRYTNSRVYSNPYHHPTSFSTGRHLFHSTLNKICFHQSSRIFFSFFSQLYRGYCAACDQYKTEHSSNAAVVDPLERRIKKGARYRDKLEKKERRKRGKTAIHGSGIGLAHRSRNETDD